MGFATHTILRICLTVKAVGDKAESPPFVMKCHARKNAVVWHGIEKLIA